MKEADPNQLADGQGVCLGAGDGCSQLGGCDKATWLGRRAKSNRRVAMPVSSKESWPGLNAAFFKSRIVEKRRHGR